MSPRNAQELPVRPVAALPRRYPPRDPRVSAGWRPQDAAHRGRPPSSFSAVSLFSGCGGLDFGAEQTGRVKTIWAVDNDPAAVRSYRYNLGDHVWQADITEVEFPDVVSRACSLTNVPRFFRISRCRGRKRGGPHRSIVLRSNRLSRLASHDH